MLINNNIDYKKKYIKYKLKYLNLKKNKNLIGSGFSSMFNYIPNVLTMKNIGTKYIPDISKIENIGSKYIPNISTMENVGFNLFINNLPPKQQKIFYDLESSGLLTEQNKSIIFGLMSKSLTHFIDPKFYPILFTVFENLVILAGSAETLTIPIIAKALYGLYDSLNDIKKLYPEDFIELQKFLSINKNKLLQVIYKNSNANPQIINLMYNVFNKLIEIDPNLYKKNINNQQNQQHKNIEPINQQPINQQSIYQQSINQQPIYQQPIYQQSKFIPINQQSI